MTDAIKRLRDASYVDDCDGNCEGWDSVHLDDSERILTDAVAAERARIREAVDALIEFCHHEYPCLLAQGHEGRPTKDGGYETRYGDKWYPRDEKPACTCGLADAITEVCGGTHD